MSIIKSSIRRSSFDFRNPEKNGYDLVIRILLSSILKQLLEEREIELKVYLSQMVVGVQIVGFFRMKL